MSPRDGARAVRRGEVGRHRRRRRRTQWDLVLPESGRARGRRDACARERCARASHEHGQVYDAFAAHWVDVYAPKIYRRFYEGATSAREFLLSLDRIHDVVTRSIEGATPPRFTYQWADARTLRMTYRSERGLLDLFEALALALGRHFGEELRTRQIGRDILEVVFPSEGPTELPR